MIYEFAATQDLHGYSKPWAAGEGPNILYLSEYSGSFYNAAIGTSLASTSAIYSGTDTNSSPMVQTNAAGYGGALYVTDLLEAGDYYLSGTYGAGVTGRGSYFVLDSDYVVVRRINNILTDGALTPFYASTTITEEEAAAGCRIGMVFGSAGAATCDIYNLECHVGGTALDKWYPYSNVCLPEGFNIWNPTTQEYIQVYAGYVNSNTRELYLRPVYEEYAGEELVGPWMSSLDLYSEDATPTEGAFVIDFGGELTSLEITPFMLQTLLDSLGIRQHFTDGAGLLNSLMDQAQGRVRSEAELLNRSLPLKVIAIGDQLPAGITFKPISKDVLPGLPGKFIR